MSTTVYRPGVDVVQAGGSLTITDDDGAPLQIIGTQPDGTVGVVTQNGPPPETVSDPIVVPTTLGLTVTWDGLLADQAPGAVLNVNTGFEAGLDPWDTSTDAVLQSGTQKHSGSFAAQITPDGIADTISFSSERVGVTDGQDYQVAGWVWPTETVAGAFTLSIDWYDTDGQFLSTSSTLESLPATAWSEVLNSYTAPAGAFWAAITATLTTPGTPIDAGQVFYLDDVTLRSVTFDTPADFDHVAIHVSTSSGFTPDASTLQATLARAGSLPISPLIAGETYYVRLVGVNTSGIGGTPSAQVSGVPIEVVATDIADGIVTTLKLADSAVTNAKIANTAVDANKLADGSVNAAKIVAAAIDSTKLADGSVLNAKLAAGAVDTAKLADGSVNAAKILDGSIGTGEINFTARAIGGVTTTIAASAPSGPLTGDIWIDSANGYRLNRWTGTAWTAIQYGTGALAANSVTAAVIAANTITAAQIAAGAITAAQIAAGTITGDRMVANTITATQIAAGAIGATQIAANTIVAGNIAAGAIGATQLAANSVIAGKIAAGVVDATAIAAGAVTTAKLAALSVTAAQIAANTITAGQIAAGTITAAQIAAGTITATQIAANAITADKLAATLLLASTIIAGTAGGARVQFDQYGLNAYDGIHPDPTVSITNLGNAIFNGSAVSASLLNASSIELDAGPSGSFVMYGVTGAAVNANPDFAANITNWTADPANPGISLAYSATHTWNGHNTLRIVGTGADPIYVDSELFTVIAGDTYTVDVTGFCEAGMSVQVQLVLTDSSGGTVYASAAQYLPTPRGQFQSASFSVGGAPSAVKGRIILGVSGGTNAVYIGRAGATLVDPVQVASLAPAAGTDQNGNAYPAGLAVKGAIHAGSITAGNLQAGALVQNTSATGRVTLTNPFNNAAARFVGQIDDSNTLYVAKLVSVSSTAVTWQIRRSDTGAVAASNQSVTVDWIGMLPVA